MIQLKLKTSLILVFLISLFPIQIVASELAPGKNDKDKAHFSPNDLGIVLEKHPDQAKFDFSSKENEPKLLEGLVSTKIENVESPDAGSYTVEIASGLSIVDRRRKKLIPFEIAYPKNSGHFPVIVFFPCGYRFRTRLSSPGCILGKSWLYYSRTDPQRCSFT